MQLPCILIYIKIMDNIVRILVIGAGPAGLSTLKALKRLPSLEKYEIVCIQKQPQWSGQWNYTWRGTTDKYGEHVHSSMYSQLWTNLPKECFQFPDYTFKDHFGKPVPTYLPRQIFKGYFMKRFQREGLKKYVKFNCTARNVKYVQQVSKFQVRYTNLELKKDTIQNFDYVIVATGHYSYPVIPTFKGIQLFKGKIAHCHELKQFNQFKGKNVLVIGGSYSAQDVTLQCYKYGASKITWTYRGLKTKYVMDQIPKNIQLIGGLTQFDQNYAYFSNGQKREIDAILMCTGYIHHYPFMQESLRLQCQNPNVLWPDGLYMSCAWQKNPKLFYIGMGSYRLSQIVFDAQGYLIKDIISGKHQLPDLSTKTQGDLQREKQMRQAQSGKDLMNSGIKYVKLLMQITDYPKFAVQNFVPIFEDSVKNRTQNFLTYRDVGVYKSIHTGQQSCLGNKKWIQMMQVQPTNPKSKQLLKQFFEF